MYETLVAEWPITRTAAAQRTLCTKSGDERRGYFHEDMLDFIPYNNICPDDLHLRMRISSKLFNQVRILDQIPGLGVQNCEPVQFELNSTEKKSYALRPFDAICSRSGGTLTRLLHYLHIRALAFRLYISSCAAYLHIYTVLFHLKLCTNYFLQCF